MIPRNGGDHERHRLLSFALGHGRVPLSISGLSGIARRQIPDTEAAMVTVGNRDSAEGVTVPGREW
jgi:hypothetical protein